MSIGACDICNRQSVPVTHFWPDANNTGIETTACYLCIGDDDADPYGELKETNTERASS